MPTIATDDERGQRIVWRYDELRRAGYPADVATLLAKRDLVDLHQACDLLKHGCPLEVALEILR
jgi:hypothetical protein